MFQTEVEFTLPLGLIDAAGTLHRTGVMRRATAADEILPLRDHRVQANPAYLVVILLSRVITHLDGVEEITPRTIEGIFSTDLAYLQDLYNQLNGPPSTLEGASARCPQCGHQPAPDAGYETGSNGLGGVVGYPIDQIMSEVAFIAYHFHWSPQDILELEHSDRRHWVAAISAINTEINTAGAEI